MSLHRHWTQKSTTEMTSEELTLARRAARDSLKRRQNAIVRMQADLRDLHVRVGLIDSERRRRKQGAPGDQVQ